MTSPSIPFDCQTCGACCAFSDTWPRFTLEDEAVLARIPAALVNDAGSGMRCIGARCGALTGTVGVTVACTAYNVRPDVCRECSPGDEACTIARARFNLPALGADTTC